MASPTAAKRVSDLADRIHAMIAAGDYAPGQALPQEELALAFGVSRTPIREALSQLEAKGVIAQAHRRTAVVRVPSTREIRETYRVRAEVEGLAAELAAEWITDAALAELGCVHVRFEHAVAALQACREEARGAKARLDKASAAWIAANARFHDIIHEAGGNRCLRRVIDDLHLGHIRHVMRSSALGMDHHRMRRTIAHHAAILRALEARDPAAARRATAEHVLESGELVVAWFENRG